MEHSPWEANIYSATEENSPPFMEPENLLPSSQQAATAPYPVPDESSLHFSTLFPQDPF
jgi:hypothetical protein